MLIAFAFFAFALICEITAHARDLRLVACTALLEMMLPRYWIWLITRNKTNYYDDHSAVTSRASKVKLERGYWLRSAARNEMNVFVHAVFSFSNEEASRYSIRLWRNANRYVVCAIYQERRWVSRPRKNTLVSIFRWQKNSIHFLVAYQMKLPPQANRNDGRAMRA